MDAATSIGFRLKEGEYILTFSVPKDKEMWMEKLKNKA
jgi:hypothetical protein